MFEIYEFAILLFNIYEIRMQIIQNWEKINNVLENCNSFKDSAASNQRFIYCKNLNGAQNVSEKWVGT